MRAVLFSGQGAQVSGMGLPLMEQAHARGVIEQLEKLFPGLISLITEADDFELAKTVNTQPAVFAVTVAKLAEYEGEFDMMAGFSLGEYAALYASGVLSLEEAFSLLLKRAEWMQECAVENRGGMVVVLGNDVDVEILARETGVFAANFNCPGQTVVSGMEEKLSVFLEVCKKEKIAAKRLSVNGAFHSPFMKGVAEKLKKEMDTISFGISNIPIYSNVTGLPYEKDRMKELLADQVMCPVQFERTIRNMIKAGADTFVEIGIGKTLAGFIKRIDKSLSCQVV